MPFSFNFGGFNPGGFNTGGFQGEEGGFTPPPKKPRKARKAVGSPVAACLSTWR